MRLIQISAVVAAFAILLVVTILPIQANSGFGKAGWTMEASAKASP